MTTLTLPPIPVEEVGDFVKRWKDADSEQPAIQVERTQYRILTPVEIESIAWVFHERDADIPSPAKSVVIGAVVAGQVVGFVVLELRLHTEPMWIRPGWSATFPALVGAAEQHVLDTSGPQWVYLTADAPRVQKLAESIGMEEQPGKLYAKLLVPTIPAKGLVGIEGVDNELRSTEHHEGSEQQSGGDEQPSIEHAVPTSDSGGVGPFESGAEHDPTGSELLQYTSQRESASGDGSTPA